MQWVESAPFAKLSSAPRRSELIPSFHTIARICTISGVQIPCVAASPRQTLGGMESEKLTTGQDTTLQLVGSPFGIGVFSGLVGRRRP